MTNENDGSIDGKRSINEGYQPSQKVTSPIAMILLSEDIAR